MKDSSTYEKRFKAFLAKLRKVYAPPAPTGLPTDPTQELLWSALLEDTSEGTAKVALSRLTGHFVDFNELRVSQPDEIVGVMPNTLGDGRVRAARMSGALQAMFDKFNTLQISELREHGKREARGFIAAMPQMTAFVEGRVCLFALGIHALPVDRTLIDLLRDRGVVHPETDPRDTQGFLERIVPAKDAVEVAVLLEAFRQLPEKVPATARPKRPAKPARPPAATKSSASERKPAGKKK